MLAQVLLIFVAAVVLDVLVTYYTKSVAHGQPVRAAIFSGLVTLANLGLLSAVLSTAETMGAAGAVAMASGAAVGTLVGVRGKRPA
ncbi:MAG: hypothetical protein HY791_25360 [Deltaproteobacteria bacterium]|nr:hypothetical protein [Deltaproteobacteria bacterium]